MITDERLEELANDKMICKVGWDERVSMAQELLALRKATAPAYHEEAKNLANLYGVSFVVFRYNEAPAVADPTKVIISFTDKGFGHKPELPEAPC